MKNLSMAVVVRNGCVLVQKRYRHNQGMVFEFPGGAVDPKESGVQAAVRELWEETGISNVKALGSHTLTNQFGGDIHYVLMATSAGIEPEALDPERQQSFYWFDPTDIPLTDFYDADIE
uniref:NUDIX hydrolase n=1 Tax=Thaumasiovibrio subtropicus TaxID=1891207 RepID=UPI000B34C65E